MTEPAAPPEPAPRCQMCFWYPSDTGPVLPIGLNDKYVDIGHFGADYNYQNCARQAGEEVRGAFRAAYRAAHPTPASAS